MTFIFMNMYKVDEAPVECEHSLLSLFLSVSVYCKHTCGPSILSPKYHDIHPVCSYYLVPKNGTHQHCILALVSYALTSKIILLVAVCVFSGLLWV